MRKASVALLRGLGVGGQHQVDKLAGGLALAVHGAGDAAAGIDQQAQPEGQFAFARKALDDLRTAILGQREVGCREVVTMAPFLSRTVTGSRTSRAWTLKVATGWSAAAAWA